MKNTVLSVIRKLLIVLLFILLFTGIDSCKKDELPLSVAQSISGLSDNQKVHPGELTAWINTTLSDDKQAQIQLTKAQQNLINQKHVVRVPIGKDAALFFTKVNGKMQVYAYKWLNKNPGTKLYTGYITAYSFQTNTAKQFTYHDSKVIKENYLKVNIETKTIEPVHGPSATSIFDPVPIRQSTEISDNVFDNIFGEFWCWLTGGQYIHQSDIDNGYSYGANGEPGATGCDYSGSGGGGEGSGDGDASDAAGDYGFSSGAFSFGDPTSGSAPDINHGDGLPWVNVYVPNPNGCVTDDGGTESFVPDCSPGEWVSFSLFTTPDIISAPVNNSSNIDDTDNSGNVVNTDCSSFAFIKTSVANWQEAGVTNIRLKWVWIGGSNGGMSRTIFLPSIVFGLPTQYQNSNGSITYLSAGQAAVRAAEVTEAAKQNTYYEFQQSPYSPTDAEVLIYFKNQLTLLMATQRGTAGATGSGSSNIVFKDEVRSDFFPYSCN